MGIAQVAKQTGAELGARGPLALQSYTHPVDNTSYVVTYSEEQHDKYVYDVSKYKFSERYYQTPELWGNGNYDEDAPISELVHSEIWRQVQNITSYMQSAHELRIQGIVAEFLLSDYEQVVLH